MNIRYSRIQMKEDDVCALCEKPLPKGAKAYQAQTHSAYILCPGCARKENADARAKDKAVKCTHPTPEASGGECIHPEGRAAKPRCIHCNGATVTAYIRKGAAGSKGCQRIGFWCGNCRAFLCAEK